MSKSERIVICGYRFGNQAKCAKIFKNGLLYINTYLVTNLVTIIKLLRWIP